MTAPLSEFAHKRDDSIITISPSVTLTPTGLQFQSAVSFDEWQTVGLKLREVRGMVHWWIGDWLNYGEERWGEMYTQALEETPYSHGTLRNDKYVASRFVKSRRRDALSWSHHADVAGLEPAEQDALLDRAERMNLKREAFRAEVKKHKDFPELCLAFVALASALKDSPTLTPPQAAAVAAVIAAFEEAG